MRMAGTAGSSRPTPRSLNAAWSADGKRAAFVRGSEIRDVVLVRSDPRDIISVLSLSAATHAKMLQNMFWATGYNVVAIPLAAGVAYNAGILLSPAIGAAVMSLSTIIVAVNARLLARADLG